MQSDYRVSSKPVRLDRNSKKQNVLLLINLEITGLVLVES